MATLEATFQIMGWYVKHISALEMEEIILSYLSLFLKVEDSKQYLYHLQKSAQYPITLDISS